MAADERAKSVDPTADTIPSDGARDRRGAPAGGDDPTRDPLVGRTLGHFRIDALIGRGGMGAVYRAWDTSLERPVALKTLLFDDAPAMPSEPQHPARARFLREARAQAQLRHPHVVPIHFVGEAQLGAGASITYIVMELVDGESVAAMLDRHRFLPEERALDIVDAVAQALEAAHAHGLIHRDIKPSNILVERTGRVLLADFGLAKTLGERDVRELPAPARGMSGVVAGKNQSGEQLTNAGAIVGTPTYLAPEQAAGSAAVDHRADIYALGVTLYELLTGEPPFTAPTKTGVIEQHKAQEALSPRVLAPELRPDVERVVMRMLEKRPEKRFSTYAELRAAIAAARSRPLTNAPFFPRVVAFGIDFAVFGIVGALFGLVNGLLLWPAAAVIMGVVEARWGRTPGKRLMGLRTVDRFGGTPKYGAAIARAVVKLGGPILVMVAGAIAQKSRVGGVVEVLVVAPWLVGLALALGPRYAALHDRVARTRVVLVVKNQ